MEEAEKKIFEAVSELLKNYPDYEKPFFRTDGDLVIPLNSSLKKNREAHMILLREQLRHIRIILH